MSKHIIIIYYTHSGKTISIAEKILSTFSNLETNDIEMSLMDAKNIDYALIKEADGYIIGTPNYFDSPSGHIKVFFDTVFEERITLSNRPVFWFVSHGGSGPLEQLESLCKWLELKIIGDPILVNGETPSKLNMDIIENNLKEMIEKL